MTAVNIEGLLKDIRRLAVRPVRLMEVCGGQTHAILRYGLDTLLPKEVQLLHGPGCPVCVTPAGYLDQAIALARRTEVVLCTFGDLLRVPSGRSGDLFAAKAAGADVRVVLSPLQALELAKREPERQVVMLSIGFETTAPAHALAVQLAQQEGVENFSVLASLFLVPPVLRYICRDAEAAPDAFLAAGHVCAVTGTKDYAALAKEVKRPIAITGFEPEDILYGVWRALLLWSEGRAECVNAYPAMVAEDGNVQAKDLMARVFQTADREWRGLGRMADSGLVLSDDYAAYDAARKFDLPNEVECAGTSPCPAEEVLLGRRQPVDCPHFGGACTPENPLGAPMVSPEGACAAFYKHRPKIG